MSKQEWIEMYGGKEILASEGFDVVPCRCPDPFCKGWQGMASEEKTSATVPAWLSNWLHVVYQRRHFGVLEQVLDNLISLV